MDFLDNVNYSKDHAWVKTDSNTATIGITDFAQNELGEIVYVDFPRVGQLFKKDEIYGSIEAVKTTSDLYMPVGGEVVEVNLNLSKTPTLVNTAPFSDGWILKIRITDISEINNLLDADTYKKNVNA